MNWRWVLLMAWRDGRRRWSRLLLFTSSIIMGIAALVSISGFHDNLSDDIDRQAAELLGADFVLESRREPTEAAQQFIDSIGQFSQATAKEERFMSMVRASSTTSSRLVQVRALAGDFPFYGQMEDQPKGSFLKLADQQEGFWIENTLFQQLGVRLGDTLQLGKKNLPILGNVLSQPGQRSLSSALAPSVFVSLSQLENSGLRQQGSRVEYLYYFVLPEGTNSQQLLADSDGQLDLLQLRASTTETVKRDTGRSFEDMASFMELSGFVALLLGCIGVWSAAQVFVREKHAAVAILRCMGASASTAFYIYLTQFVVMGLLGGIVGTLLGTALQFFIPLLLQDVLPVRLNPQISWSAIGQGLLMGPIVAGLFALLPLSSVRRISPLRSLRIGQTSQTPYIDRLSGLVYLLILGFVVIYARMQMDDWRDTFLFVAGMLVIFLLLFLFAKVTINLIKRYFLSDLPYLFRQGLANLYRPNNQTGTLIFVIGLGTALIGSMLLIQDLLLQRVQHASQQSQANMLLFDIQPSQRGPLLALAEDKQYQITETVPVVTMHLERVRGLDLQEVLADSTLDVSARAFRGEIRATYRDSLTAAEQLVDGKWVGQVNASEMASVSLDQSYAERLGVEIGDQLEFNVQGLQVPAQVASIRQVDWNRFQSNFRVVFAKGSIDQAPQFYLMTAQLPSPDQALAFQTDVVGTFPNVSVVDLHAMLDILTMLLDRISFVVRFLAGFSVLTGILVLIGALRISKRQRIAENVTLRTLGADSRQIYWINFSEYFSLGLLASIVGIVLALLVAYFLAIFVFDMSYTPDLSVVLILLALSTSITAVIGILNSISVIRTPPLESLRKS
ncbi:MAG: ABC transporter permease [Sphingobacterium sp.]